MWKKRSSYQSLILLFLWPIISGASLTIDVSSSDFNRLVEFSKRTAISYEDGIQALVELPHTIPKHSISQNKYDYKNELQKQYNKTHNRLFILTQVARLKMQIQQIQEKLNVPHTRRRRQRHRQQRSSSVIANQERDALRLSLKQEQLKQLEDFQRDRYIPDYYLFDATDDLPDIYSPFFSKISKSRKSPFFKAKVSKAGFSKSRLQEPIFHFMEFINDESKQRKTQGTFVNEALFFEDYTRVKYLLRENFPPQGLKDLELLVNYIAMIPQDIRNLEHEMELKWAQEALWLYEDISIFKQLTDNGYHPFKFSITTDFTAIKHQVSDMNIPTDSKILLMDFIDLSAQVATFQDRLFGTLIETSTLAQDWLSNEHNQLSLDMHNPLSYSEITFLTELGIENWKPNKLNKDLSHLYRPSLLQGKSKACVGFSLADDIHFYMMNSLLLRHDESVSPFTTYGAIHSYLDKSATPCLNFEHNKKQLKLDGLLESNENYNGYSYSRWKPDVGVPSDQIEDAIYSFRYPNNALCLVGYDDNSYLYVSSRIIVEQFKNYAQRMSFNFLRAMIDHHKPPILLINSDVRMEMEDWMQITDPSKEMGHTLIVVGYGISDDINPFTLQREPYFIVRDSLGINPIHYRIGAQNLLEHTYELIKVTEVKKI